MASKPKPKSTSKPKPKLKPKSKSKSKSNVGAKPNLTSTTSTVKSANKVWIATHGFMVRMTFGAVLTGAPPRATAKEWIVNGSKFRKLLDEHTNGSDPSRDDEPPDWRSWWLNEGYTTVTERAESLDDIDLSAAKSFIWAEVRFAQPHGLKEALAKLARFFTLLDAVADEDRAGRVAFVWMSVYRDTH